MKTNNHNALTAVNIIAYVVTVAVNALSQFLPLNGVTPREVSESYPNLFTPAPVTFAIWGVIYAMLAVFVLSDAGVFGKSGVHKDAARRVGWLFALSCVFNVAWIFCWHYYLIPLSLVCMVALFVTLAAAFVRICREPLSFKEKLTVKLPFGVYFGWITVALIANVSAALVSVGWDGFGISEVWWTVAVLILGAVVGVAVILTKSSWGYGAATVWSYAGIIIKHVGADGYNGEYPKIIAVAAVCAVLLFAASVYAAVKDLRKNDA